jgi:hypothetical protein
MQGTAASDVLEVEVRLAAELAAFARPRSMSGARIPPHPYVRRYAVEHASEGGVLDERFINLEFLPYADAGRLRAVGFRVADSTTERHRRPPACVAAVRIFVAVGRP